MREAFAVDVRFLACSMAKVSFVGADESLLESAGHAGTTVFVARTLDPA